MDGYAITTIVFFLINVILVICPIPLRVPYTRVRIRLDTSTAPLLCVIILAASQCIPIQTFRDGIVGTGGIKPYNILVLFFSLAYMAISLDLTGILQSAAFWIANHGGRRGISLYTSFYLFSIVLSIILGNDPVILSGTAFLVYFTKVAELNPQAWLFAEFVSCNIGSLVLFVGNPTNVVLCEGFQLPYLTYTAFTILPFFGCTIVAYLVLILQFWKKIPKNINAPELDARAVLLDPLGAVVGSVMLISCLIIIIGVSFVGVDVWEITLPFAVLKLVFDIIWDGIRTRKREEPEELQLKNQNPTVTPQTEDQNLRYRRFNSVIRFKNRIKSKFPTAYTSVKRLPIGLLPFALSQFIIVEALVYHGWVKIFSGWMSYLTTSSAATVFSVGILSVILCNIVGTNILATILLTKIIQNLRTLDAISIRAASISLAVGSNIGAFSFAFSASLAGLLWRNILRQKGIRIKAFQFLKFNLFPICLTSLVGFGIVWVEIYACEHFINCHIHNITNMSM